MPEGRGIKRIGEFAELVDELEELEVCREAGGELAPRDAERRQHIERRLLELVTTRLPEEERRCFIRLACQNLVMVCAGCRQMTGVLADIGAGGVFIETGLRAAVGDTVELEIEGTAGSAAHGLRVKGTVVWSAPASSRRMGLGIAFSTLDDSTERRARRFVLAVLRERLSSAA